MVRLEWHEGLATGDPVVDRQHRDICELTKDLITIVECGDDLALTGDVLSGLMRYVLVHFADEEALMARVGYPHLERQREQHDRYRTTAASMTAAFIDERIPAVTVLNYMLDWWHDHICSEDLELAAFVRERGVEGFEA